jgi:hypothetical protein
MLSFRLSWILLLNKEEKGEGMRLTILSMAITLFLGFIQTCLVRETIPTVMEVMATYISIRLLFEITFERRKEKG